jgi:nucleoside-diphosphate-sugar epimerase
VAIFATMMLSGRAPRINAAREAGDRGCVRDYVYVGDVARASLTVLDRGDDDVFNIATESETTTADLYRMVAESAGFPDPPGSGPPRPGDVLRSVLSRRKAERVLGWRPRTSLREGVAQTVEYFRHVS